MNEQCGIYKIENLINHKIYIGQSRCINKRWKNHKKTAFNPNDDGYNYPLYQAIRKYGIDNFNFSIVENCLPEELNDKEIYWIKYYNSYQEGYNQTEGGDSQLHNAKLNWSDVYEIVELLQNTSKTQKQIAEKYSIDPSIISNINSGKSWYQADKNYPIRPLQNQPRKKCFKCNRLLANPKLTFNEEEFCQYCISEQKIKDNNIKLNFDGDGDSNNIEIRKIYRIINLRNNFSYIGSTYHNLSSVLLEFISDAKGKMNLKRPIFEAIRENNYQDFEIILLETVITEEVEERVRYWINYYRTYINFPDSQGYNSSLSGGNARLMYNYEEIVKKYQELKSVKDTAHYFNCSVDTVRTACKQYNIPISHTFKKAIIKIDLQTDEETVYDSASDAAILCFPEKFTESCRKNISRAANHNGTAYGYKWKFKDQN